MVKMATKHKNAKFPQTALAFYIRLYCNRKGSSTTKYNSNLVEATKTWVSLSESEKQQFQRKYKESEEKLKLQCLNQLKNAEPFMKVKDARLKNVDNDMSASNIETHEPLDIDQAEQIDNNEGVTLDNVEEIPDNDIVTEQRHDKHTEIIMEEIDANNQSSRTLPPTILVEPLPPTLKTGSDLFQMLNSTDDTNSITWPSLPELERKQYTRAVLLLKKDYITKYKAYLESLEPRELFDYYIRKKS